MWVLTPPKCVRFDNAVVAIRLPFLACPLLTLHHHFSQDPVDSRLVARAFGLEPIHNLYIHAQRDSPFARTVPARLPPVSSSARDNSSSSIEAPTQPSFPGSDRPFRRFAFFFLTVMTQSYARNRHDAMFPVKHSKIWARRAVPAAQAYE